MINSRKEQTFLNALFASKWYWNQKNATHAHQSIVIVVSQDSKKKFAQKNVRATTELIGEF
jgi:hypothetical protein